MKITLIIAMLALTPPDQATPDEATLDQAAPDRTAPAASPATSEGLWPSPKLMNLMLQRWADDICDEFELSESQRPQVREAVVDRWGTFLDEHRETLQPLVNEFLEMRLDREPPSKEQVQAWAERARPIFEEVRQQVGKGTDEFRQLLTPGQRGKFEVQALHLGLGIQMADRKLRQLEIGEFQPRDIWDPPGREGRRSRRERRRQRQDRQERAAESVAPERKDPIAAEMDAWEKYVADFCATYDLNEGQRDAARSCLSEVKERAIAHRERYREEIARLEGRIEAFQGADSELAELRRQLTELYGPIDDMFRELQRRLEPIPTVEQRARAAKPSPDAVKPSEPSAKPATPPPGEKNDE
jgi:hypothetical protein